MKTTGGKQIAFGFFTRADLQAGKSATAKRKAADFPIERLHELECRACPLDKAKNCTPKMDPSGSKKPRIYVLGDSPSKDDDKHGEPFSGEAGRRLRNALGRAVAADSRFNMTIRDRLPGGGNPDPVSTECCRPSIEKDIVTSKPEAILTMGPVAAAWFGAKGGNPVWRGRHFPAQIGDRTFWVFPITHPTEVLRVEDDFMLGGPEIEKLFRRDVSSALRVLPQLPPPRVWMEEDAARGLVALRGGPVDLKRFLELLDEIEADDGAVAIDLETREVRPYHQDAQLLTVSLSIRGKTLAFAWNHPEAEWSPEERGIVEKRFIGFLKGMRKRPLVAHNASFECEWLVVLFGKWVADLDWHDTMVQAYVLDERQGGLSLDFLSFLHFGLPLKSLSDVDRKNLHREPLTAVLKYNGMDSSVARALFIRQNRLLANQDLLAVYLFHLRRISTLVLAQISGLPIDLPTVRSLLADYEAKRDAVMLKIRARRAVKTFEQRQGTFNPASPQHVTTIFRDILKRTEGATAKGYSTDEEALLKMEDEPLAQLMISWREWNKLATTSMRPLLPESEKTVIYPDGLIHTSLKHTGTITTRIASEKPNNQNWPKHAHREVRSVVKAPPGFKLVAADQGQIDYRVIAISSQDQTILDALRSGYDVHLHWAEKIFRAYPRVMANHKLAKTDMKGLRSIVKNSMVFPAFYRASQGTISKATRVPDRIMDPIFEEFWDDFSGVRKWQESLLRYYDRHGFVRSLSGRRLWGPKKPQDVVNHPIQCGSAEIVQDGMDKLSRLARDGRKPWLQARNTVHDDLLFMVPDRHLDEAIEDVVREMVSCAFPWITVPLSVEVEVGPDWFRMEKVGTFSSADLAA